MLGRCTDRILDFGWEPSFWAAVLRCYPSLLFVRSYCCTNSTTWAPWLFLSDSSMRPNCEACCPIGLYIRHRECCRILFWPLHEEHSHDSEVHSNQCRFLEKSSWKDKYNKIYIVSYTFVRIKFRKVKNFGRCVVSSAHYKLHFFSELFTDWNIMRATISHM